MNSFFGYQGSAPSTPSLCSTEVCARLLLLAASPGSLSRPKPPRSQHLRPPPPPPLSVSHPAPRVLHLLLPGNCCGYQTRRGGTEKMRSGRRGAVRQRRGLECSDSPAPMQTTSDRQRPQWTAPTPHPPPGLPQRYIQLMDRLNIFSSLKRSVEGLLSAGTLQKE